MPDQDLPKLREIPCASALLDRKTVAKTPHSAWLNRNRNNHVDRQPLAGQRSLPNDLLEAHILDGIVVENPFDPVDSDDHLATGNLAATKDLIVF